MHVISVHLKDIPDQKPNLQLPEFHNVTLKVATFHSLTDGQQRVDTTSCHRPRKKQMRPARLLSSCSSMSHVFLSHFVISLHHITVS